MFLMVKAESTGVDKLTWFAAWSFRKSEENIGSVNNVAFYSVSCASHVSFAQN